MILTNPHVVIKEVSNTSEILFCGVSINDWDKLEDVEVSIDGISSDFPGLIASYLWSNVRDSNSQFDNAWF